MLSNWLRFPRRRGRELRFLRTTGFFCDPYSDAFREREARRLADVAGPQADFIARHSTGWQFSDCVPPICVLAVPAGANECVAIGWASVTSLGVNLTYAVATQAQGQGLARKVTGLALLELDDWVGGLNPTGWVHAQYDVANLASAAVARSLGLVADASLELRCSMPGGRTRHFLGARTSVETALRAARQIAGDAEVCPLPHPRYRAPHASSDFSALARR